MEKSSQSVESKYVFYQLTPCLLRISQDRSKNMGVCALLKTKEKYLVKLAYFFLESWLIFQHTTWPLLFQMVHSSLYPSLTLFPLSEHHQCNFPLETSSFPKVWAHSKILPLLGNNPCPFLVFQSSTLITIYVYNESLDYCVGLTLAGC